MVPIAMIEPARIGAFVFALFFAAAFAEWIWRTRLAKRSYDVGAAAASLGVAMGQALLKPLTAGFISGLMFFASELAPWRLPVGDWRVWVAGFFAVEFCYYWSHRWSHTIRWVWATHAVHHSAEEMTLPAAIRLGWTGFLSGAWLAFLPLALLGFPPVMILALLGANLLYQYFLHTEAVGKLGALEWVFNTPSHHRVHHASNPDYIDKNFGGVLIVFDRLFGTFAAERSDIQIRYGLVKGTNSRNPFIIALHEWGRLAADLARARSLGQAFQAAFGRPH